MPIRSVNLTAAEAAALRELSNRFPASDLARKAAMNAVKREMSLSGMLGGILLLVIPTVLYRGMTLLGLLTRNVPGYDHLAYIGAAFLAAAVLSLGVSLIRAARRTA